MVAAHLAIIPPALAVLHPLPPHAEHSLMAGDHAHLAITLPVKAALRINSSI
jgi:hypothetical protein